MCKIITIPSLVWLRSTARRWCFRAAVARPDYKEMDGAVPAGHVAVRVEGRAGGGSTRFLVRLAHLNHPAFRELLRQAEEEYGFPSASGPIALPCDEDHLLDVLRRASSEERLRGRSFCCCGPVSRSVTARRGDSRPLLQGMAVVCGEARLVIDQPRAAGPADRSYVHRSFSRLCPNGS